MTSMHGLNFTLKSWAESLVLMSVEYAWPLSEVNSFTVCNSVYHLWTACMPLSVMVYDSTVVTRATRVVFAPGLFHTMQLATLWLLSSLHQKQAEHETFSLCECAHFKFMLYGRRQASKHTHTHAQCSPASMGLARACPNKSWWKHAHVVRNQHEAWYLQFVYREESVYAQAVDTRSLFLFTLDQLQG